MKNISTDTHTKSREGNQRVPMILLLLSDCESFSLPSNPAMYIERSQRSFVAACSDSFASINTVPRAPLVSFRCVSISFRLKNEWLDDDDDVVEVVSFPMIACIEVANESNRLITWF